MEPCREPTTEKVLRFLQQVQIKDSCRRFHWQRRRWNHRTHTQFGKVPQHLKECVAVNLNVARSVGAVEQSADKKLRKPRVVSPFGAKSRNAKRKKNSWLVLMAMTNSFVEPCSQAAKERKEHLEHMLLVHSLQSRHLFVHSS